MVDHDVFRWNVVPGFQSASRAVFDRSDPGRALERTLYAGSAALKDGGCRGLREIEEALSEYVYSPKAERQLDRTLAELEQINRACADERTGRAVATAKECVRTLPDHEDRRGFSREAYVQQHLIKRIIIDFIDARVFSCRLMQALIERRRESFASVRQRREEFLAELERSDGLAKLARELRANPEGGHVRLQRAKRQPIDQLAMAKTVALA